MCLQSSYNSLEKVLEYVTSASSFDCSIIYDSWDVRTDNKGEMEKCLLIKKSSMHALKLHFTNTNEVMLCYIIPNKTMNAYFGRSQKAYRNLIEIAAEGIKNVLLSSSQKKAFQEMEAIVFQISI